MFHTRNGVPIGLDEIAAITIRPMVRPAPADTMTNPDDRAQAAREIADWTKFPYEVMVELDDRGQAYLYGAEARDLAAAFYEGLRPWLSPR
jgi:hypothetical protein